MAAIATQGRTLTVEEGEKVIGRTRYSVTRAHYEWRRDSGEVRRSVCWSLTGPRGGVVMVSTNPYGELVSINMTANPSAATVFDRKGIRFHRNADGTLGWTDR